MPSLNEVTIMGHLGKDPETRYSADGAAITNITVATTDKWKDKQGEMQEATEWHRIVFFGRRAEVVGEYFKKGDPIYVRGSLRTRKWVDKDGNDRYTTEITAKDFQFLKSNRRDDDEPRAARQTRTSNPAPEKSAPPAVAEMDDDIPF